MCVSRIRARPDPCTAPHIHSSHPIVAVELLFPISSHHCVSENPADQRFRRRNVLDCEETIDSLRTTVLDFYADRSYTVQLQLTSMTMLAMSFQRGLNRLIIGRSHTL